MNYVVDCALFLYANDSCLVYQLKKHCVKSVRIRSYSFRMRENTDRITPNKDTFYAVEVNPLVPGPLKGHTYVNVLVGPGTNGLR